MSTLAQSSICGRRVIETLSDGCTFITEKSGRKFVLKKVEADCMLEAQLHPSIHERLARVRELAHAGVANLYGVERDGDDAYLVWDYVEGIHYDEYAAGKTEAELNRLVRDLTLAVEAMHTRGIVHGSLHARNIFIRPTGAIQLTHINPLLYSDPQHDIDALVDLTGVSASSLAELRAKLSAAETVDETRDPVERRFRFRAALLVILAILFGIALTESAIRFARNHPAAPRTEEEIHP
jgi:serine/threonine protein kinase